MMEFDLVKLQFDNLDTKTLPSTSAQALTGIWNGLAVLTVSFEKTCCTRFVVHKNGT